MLRAFDLSSLLFSSINPINSINERESLLNLLQRLEHSTTENLLSISQKCVNYAWKRKKKVSTKLKIKSTLASKNFF